MQAKIFMEITERKRINWLLALSLLLSLSLISFFMAGCGGSGGGGGGGYIPQSGDGTVNPALFSGWKMTNGPFSGMAYSLAVDPNNSNRIYAAVGTGGLFRSDDGGLNWTHVERDLTNVSISAVAVAGDGQTIYVGTGADGIYKTVNGGGNWSPVSNGLPIDPQTQEYFDVNELFIDPGDNKIVYAKLAWSYYLYRTADGGNSWERIGLDLPFEPIMSLVIHPVSTEVLYAGTYSNGVWKSTDKGDSWTAINDNLPPYIVHFPCLAIDADNNILYAGSRDYGLYKTLNEGITWQFIQVGPNTSLENWDAYVLAMDPVDKSIIYTYVVTVSPAQPAEDGIYRTFDGGDTWEKVPFHEYPDTYRPVREIAIAPSDGNVVYVTTQGEGLFMTTGVMGVDEVGDWAPIDNGLVDLIVLALILHPWDNKIVYAGTDGIFKTIDGGLRWEKTGLEGNHISALARDPHDANIIYAATDDGVYKTTNGGDSWSGPSGYWFYGLAVAKDTQNRNIIYGGNPFGMGVYKATDDGSTPWDQVTWEKKNNGLSDDEKYVSCLAINDPADPLTLCAGIVGKVLKTQDGGDTWERKANGLPTDRAVCSLVMDPYNPQVLYAGTRIGLYASSDGGDTWVFRGGGLGQRYVRSIAIDPMDSNKVCAGTYDDGVFVSMDGGQKWTQINQGLTGDLNRRIISLAMDLRDIDNPVVYAGTGCGVFKAVK